MWQERADYGHFFYRIPNGESAADAYDRVSGFNESLWRQFGEEDCASVCVLGRCIFLFFSLLPEVLYFKWSFINLNLEANEEGYSNTWTYV